VLLCVRVNLLVVGGCNGSKPVLPGGVPLSLQQIYDLQAKFLAVKFDILHFLHRVNDTKSTPIVL
jgi:hypothetical protein